MADRVVIKIADGTEKDVTEALVAMSGRGSSWEGADPVSAAELAVLRKEQDEAMACLIDSVFDEVNRMTDHVQSELTQAMNQTRALLETRDQVHTVAMMAATIWRQVPGGPLDAAKKASEIYTETRNLLDTNKDKIND